VAVVMFMGILEGTIISTALPHMARDFGVEPVDLGVGITAYLLVSAMFLPISSWVAERLGTRRVLMAAILGFALASLLCGASTTLTGFVAARALQAFFSSLMVPVANLVLLRVTPKRQLVQMMAISTTPALIAPVIGPPLGGFITTALGWQYIFFINLPLAAIGIALVWRMVPDLRAELRAAFDLRGFLLVAAALAGAVLAMERLGAHPASWRAPALLAVAAGVTGALAVRYLRRATAPIVPLAALRHGTFRSIAFGAGFLMRLPFMGQALLLPLYFQVGFGLSPVATGVRIDRGEGDDDIVILRRDLGDFVIADPLGAHAAFGIDREQAEGDVALAIIGDRLRHRRALAVGLEIGGGRVEELRHDRILGVVARHLGMDMDVDRRDFGEVDRHFPEFPIVA
jgi:MFS family permease